MRVWLDAPIVDQKLGCFTVANTDKYPITWCAVVLSGIFESGQKYGLVGGYDMELRGK